MGDPGQPLLWVLIGLIIVFVCLTSMATGCVNAINRPVGRNGSSESDDSEMQSLQKLAEKRPQFLAALRLNSVFLILMLAGCLVSLFRDVIGFSSLYEMAGVIVALLCAVVLYAFFMAIPQLLTAAHPEKTAKRLYYFIYAIYVLFWPTVTAVSLINKHFVIKRDVTDTADDPTASWQDILDMIEEGRNNGELDTNEYEMIDGVISMHDKMAREIMVPRTDAFMVDVTNDNSRNIDSILGMDFSRVPVYHEDKDNVVGIVHIKTLVKLARNFGFDHITIRQAMRPAFFVPETMTLDELLFQMQKTRNQMAILLDEYGGVVGLVTLEDLLEEIVGEIDDESDEPDQLYQQISSDEFLVQGKMPIDDFNDEFGTDLKINDIDTIAGFLIAKLGRIPDNDEVVSVTAESSEGDVVLTTAKIIDDARITEVKVTLPDALASLHRKKEAIKKQTELKLS